MNIIEQHLLRGRNVYAAQACLLTMLDLGPLRASATHSTAGCTDGLLQLLPSLYEHRCSSGKYVEFAQARQAGINLAHAVEQVTSVGAA